MAEIVDDPRKDLERVERQLDALAENLSRRPGSDTLLRKLDHLEAQRDDLQAQIAILDGKPDRHHFSADMFRYAVEAYLEGFDFDDEDEKTRKILAAFVRRVVKTGDRILIEFNINGLDPLELDDLIGFEQSPDWCTKKMIGRTLACGPAAILVVRLAS